VGVVVTAMLSPQTYVFYAFPTASKAVAAAMV